MKTYLRKFAWFCLPALFFTATISLADSDHDTARQLRETGDILPLEVILQKLQASHPGKVLEVELKKRHDRFVYEIELLDDNGKVWEFKISPYTGEILRQKEDD